MAQGESLPSRMWRRLWRFFGSLKLAVILLIAVTVVCLLGTLFPQLAPEIACDPHASNQWLAMAREKYGALAGLYETLGLFDVYRSPWFIVPVVALLLNTLVCTANRFQATWRVISARPEMVMPDSFYERIPCRASLALAQEAGAADAARGALARRRYRVLAEEQEEATYLYADRNRWARLGTLITHLSVTLVVLGFVWSQGGGWREPAVALGPGELYQVGHGKGFQVRCDGFEVERYPDGLPKDYRARLTVLQDNSEVTSKIVRVNDPLSYRGVGFYLSSYGPAARVRAQDAMGELLPLQVIGREVSQGEVVLNFAGEGEGWDLLVPSLDLDLHVVFYYEGPSPELAEGPSLFVQVTRSDQTIFADFVYDGEAIELEDARFEFALDRYVVLQVVSDPGFKLVIFAAFLVMAGLIVSLYFPHRRIWAKVTRDKIRLAGLTVGDKVGLERELAAIVRGIGGWMSLNEMIFFNITYLCLIFSAVAYVVHLLRPGRGIGWVATGVSVVGLVVLTLGLGVRTVQAGHWPLTNTYEFTLIFLWGTVSVYLLLERAMDTRIGGAFIIPLACLVGTYAQFLIPASAKTPQPLLPALRSLWLLLHTITAAVGYGGFTASCGAGLMILIKETSLGLADRLPSLREIDAYNYRAVAFGYPWMSLAIITGAIWAQVAWGNYWSWDIKETWALMVWLVYTLFFHTRVTKGWRGRPTAIISIVGFLMVLLTFLGVGWLARRVGLESLHVY